MAIMWQAAVVFNIRTPGISDSCDAFLSRHTPTGSVRRLRSRFNIAIASGQSILPFMF
jgi:hypothetical protein